MWIDFGGDQNNVRQTSQDKPLRNEGNRINDVLSAVADPCFAHSEADELCFPLQPLHVYGVLLG